MSNRLIYYSLLLFSVTFLVACFTDTGSNTKADAPSDVCALEYEVQSCDSLLIKREDLENSLEIISNGTEGDSYVIDGTIMNHFETETLLEYLVDSIATCYGKACE